MCVWSDCVLLFYIIVLFKKAEVYDWKIQKNKTNAYKKLKKKKKIGNNTARTYARKYVPVWRKCTFSSIRP